MADPIEQAISKSSSSAKPSPPPPSAPESVLERIKKLPLVKTPELIEREAEAAEQHSKAESDRSKLKQKEESEVEPKKVAFAGNKQEYPKVEKYIEECSKINEVRDERIPTSKANVTKSKKSFTYPMKKKSGSNTPQEPPKTPDLPFKTSA